MRSLFAALLTTLLMPLPTWAEPLKVTLPDVTPYSFVAANGQVSGLHVDLIRAVSAQAQLPIVINIVPFARARFLLESGDADLAVLPLNQIKPEQIRNLGQLTSIRLVLWPAPNKTIRHLAQINGQTVGRMRGGCQMLTEQAKPVFYDLNNIDQGTRMLQAGRIDALCLSYDAVLFAIHQNGLTELSQAQTLLLEQTPVYLLGSKGLAEPKVARLQQALRKVIQSSLPQQLKVRYGISN